jgi:hypothetical protein
VTDNISHKPGRLGVPSLWPRAATMDAIGISRRTLAGTPLPVAVSLSAAERPVGGVADALAFAPSRAAGGSAGPLSVGSPNAASGALDRAAAGAAHDAALHEMFLRLGEALPVGSDGVAARVERMWEAARELADAPESWDARVGLVASLEDAVTAIRSAQRRLSALAAELRSRCRDLVRRANELAAIAARPDGADVSGPGMAPRRAEDARCEIAALMAMRWSEAGLHVVGAWHDAIVPAAEGVRIALIETSDGGPALEIASGHPAESRRIRPSSGAIAPLLATQEALPRCLAALDTVAASLRDAINDAHGHPDSRDLDDYRGADLLCGRGAADLAVCASGPRSIAARRGEDGGGNARALLEVGGAVADSASGATLRDLTARLDELPRQFLRAASEGLPGGDSASVSCPSEALRRRSLPCSS